MRTTLNLPPEISLIAKTVAGLPKQYNRKPRAMLVGGFVRDDLLGRKSKDFDMEVYGVDYSTLQQILTQLYPQHLREVGKSFGILKIHKKEFDIDVALPRTESKTGTGYHGFAFTTNPFLTCKQAAKRRDFTINAMLMDPRTGKIIDPYKGQADLQAKRLRAVNAQTFVEDPLRVYRAIQLVARFNLRVEGKTFLLMKRMVHSGELHSLSKERIRQEWQKLYTKNANPKLGLALAKRLGINYD